MTTSELADQAENAAIAQYLALRALWWPCWGRNTVVAPLRPRRRPPGGGGGR